MDLSNENWVTSSSKHNHEFRLYKTYNFVDYLFEKGDFFKCDFYTGMLDLKKKPVLMQLTRSYNTRYSYVLFNQLKHISQRFDKACPRKLFKVRIVTLHDI